VRVCWELEWQYFPQIRHLLPLLLLLLLPEGDLRKLRFEIGLTSRQFMILDPVSGWSLFRNSSPPWRRRRRRRSYGSKSPIWIGKCNRSRQQVIEHLFSLSSFAPLFFFFVVVVFISFLASPPSFSRLIKCRVPSFLQRAQICSLWWLLPCFCQPPPILLPSPLSTSMASQLLGYNNNNLGSCGQQEFRSSTMLLLLLSK